MPYVEYACEGRLLFRTETTEGSQFVPRVHEIGEDAQKLAIQMTPAERPAEVAKAKVASRKPSPVSLMPEGLVDDLSQQQFADLLAFLLAPPPQEAP